jgi:hypothetical protein
MLIDKSMTNCVCFVCCYNNDGELNPVGTAFFIGTQVVITNPPRYLLIAVTALHLINGIEDARRPDNRIFLRINTRDGGFDHLEIPSEEWIRPDPSHPDGIVDAAVCRVLAVTEDKFDVRWINDDWIANREILHAEDIGIGNEVFSAGLFIMHTATKRNEPIVRSGTIAAMPETISSKSGPQHAYLIESRSVGGLSGSPVFVEAGLTRHDGSLEIKLRTSGRASYLLGVMSGHWNAEAEIKEIGDAIQREYVNMGIAIVTPMEKVMPLIAKCILRSQSEIREQLAQLNVAKPLADAITGIMAPADAIGRSNPTSASQTQSPPYWTAVVNRPPTPKPTDQQGTSPGSA